jgi:hypothetical protein
MAETSTEADLGQFQQAFGAALAGHAVELDGMGPALSRALAIHRNTSAKAAQDALAANYPVVRALFGDEAFRACASAFVGLEPPGEPRLNAYGARFPEFLRHYAPAAGEPYVAEVAALERLYTEALFAADAAPLDGAALASGLDAEARLRLHPSVRFAAFSAPAVSIWRAHQGADDAPALADLVWAEEAALIVRPALGVNVVAIDDGALAFLSACARGETLGVAAAAAAEAGADLSTTFANLITAGAFA